MSRRFAEVPWRGVIAIIAVATLQLPLSPAVEGRSSVPSEARSVTHALNRLAFGPRPGDVERVSQMGLGTWIDEQLSPARRTDDRLAARLARLTTLTLDSAAIATEYFQPARRERRRLQQEQAAMKDDPGQTSTSRPDEQTMENGAPGGPRPGAMNDVIRRERQIFAELAEAKLIRATYSDRQLEEVLVDFWFNHFNVFARKGRTGIYIGEYERDAIRPYVFGRFRDLLGATAKSPAMLFYLDNWLSADPHATERTASLMRRGRFGARATQRPTPQPQNRPMRGLNENYARELLELHTLGVDGGYTQQDIVEVARAFTGWTIGRPGEQGFRFAAAMHDRGAKKILGETITSGGGIEDGERVLDLLARHPSTATHIARKLAERFVSDTPPQALVDRAAAAFRNTDGDLRAVVRVIVTSPEFFAPDSYRAKVKTPFEFVVSALRATDADLQVAAPIVRALAGLGMPLYLCQPPTGYDDTAATWVSSGALVNRLNFAVSMAGGQLRGVRLPPLTAPSDARERIIRDALGGDVSKATLDTIAKADTASQTIALAIGSPEFQRQ
jgi:uncharacterized protein (DUF1800 family)